MYERFQVNSFDAYSKDLRNHKLLTPIREKELAIDYYENNNPEAAKCLIESNLRFVVKVALGFKYDNGINIMDLIQEGNIGLMVAVKKFNPYKGVRLISYAVNWIKYYIRVYIKGVRSIVKQGDIQDKLNVVEVDSDEVEKPNAKKQDVSLNEMMRDRKETLLNLLVCERDNPEETLCSNDNEEKLKEKINNTLSILNDRELYIIYNRIMSDSKRTRESLAEELNITKERVRQIENNSMKKLRSKYHVA